MAPRSSTSDPDVPALGQLTLPARGIGPIASIAIRVGVALMCIVVTTVLVYVELIASDAPAAIRGNAAVQEAYLGGVHGEVA